MSARCLTDKEIQELAFEAEERVSAAVHGHLERCPACRERLSAEQRDAALFEELKGVFRPAIGPPSVPGYRITGELSRGGQGVVYRAIQETTNRVVALKVLSAGATSSARERRRFEREIELGSRLAHPGIVTVFDSGVTGGAPWYAMELVQGTTLDAFVASTGPTLEERLRLFLELCAAVAHAHRSGVIHRDLKPANVLVDGEGRVRVLDFGAALPVDAGALLRRRVTAPGEFLGTLAYASPEQVSGGSESCDTRTDVYSLGVLLYELVTGALPYEVHGGLAEVVERIAHAPPSPPAEHVPGLDRELVTVLAKALEKERERRYPSVEALARDVGHFLAHEPIEARPRRLGYVLRMGFRRHRGVVLAMAGALLAAGGLIGAFVHERLQTERAEQNAALVRSVFQDILGAAAPQRMGGDARLRDVLALAAREIETTLAGAPDAQAAVQLTIGDTYRRLLMHPEAEAHLRLALERFRSVDGDGLETAHCLDLLGQVLAAENSPAGIPVQEEALAIRRRRLADDDPRIAESERGLALALTAQLRDADTQRARALLDSALARFRAAFGPEHIEVAETELALARLDLWQNESAAEPRLVRALATLEREIGAEGRDPRLIACLTEYSLFLQSVGRYDEAEALLARAEKLTQELYGDELTTDLLRRRANLCHARGEHRNAEELTRRALSFELRRWAEHRPDESAEIERVATALDSSHPPESEPPYVEAFRLLRRFRGDGAFELAGWMNGIALVMRPQGRAAACEPLLEEALNIRCRVFGADCPVRQRTLVLLAQVLCDEQRAAEATPLLEESVAIAEHNGEAEDAREARELLARCCPAEPADASERQ